LEMITVQAVLAVQAVLGYIVKLAKDRFKLICKDCGKAPKGIAEIAGKQKLLKGKVLEFYKVMQGLEFRV